MKRLVLAAAAGTLAVAIRRDGVSCVLHNCVAHPLLVLWPAAGEWLHEHTDPTPDQGSRYR